MFIAKRPAMVLMDGKKRGWQGETKVSPQILVKIGVKLDLAC